MENKVAYPTFIAEADSAFLVYVPDMDIYTEGNSMFDAICMARDAIGLKAVDYEDDGKVLPEASSYEEAIKKAKEDADIFDYSTGTLTLIDVDTAAYRNKMLNRSVKKNCTIPYWMSVEAEKAGLNFSKVLQEALRIKLNANA